MANVPQRAEHLKVCAYNVYRVSQIGHFVLCVVDLVVKAQKGEFVEDEKVKCYMKCIMSEMACVSIPQFYLREVNGIKTIAIVLDR